MIGEPDLSMTSQFFMVVLFLNLIAMALGSHNQSELRSTLLFWLDVFFTTIFTGELTFKLVVVGPAVYFDDGVLCVRVCTCVRDS